MAEPNPDEIQSPAEVPHEIDPTVILRAKMAERRRLRDETRGMASTISPFSQERPLSHLHTEDGQGWKKSDTSQDELAALRNEVQMAAMQRQEDSNTMQDILQKLANMEEELAKHSRQETKASQQALEQNVKDKKHVVIDLTEDDDREEDDAQATGSQSSPEATLQLPSPATNNTPDPASTPPASNPPASSPPAISLPALLTPAALPGADASPLQHQYQITNAPNKKLGQAEKTGEQSRGPKRGIAKRKAGDIIEAAKETWRGRK